MLLKMISRVAYLNSQYVRYLVSRSQKHLPKHISFGEVMERDFQHVQSVLKCSSKFCKGKLKCTPWEAYFILPQ